jgi:L-lactate dehydrogenase complex protein LldG
MLGRIRQAIGDGVAVPEIPRDYRGGADLEPAAVVRMFAERVGEYRATVHQASTDSLPAVVATILAGSGATRVVVPPGLPAGWLAAVAPVTTVLTDDGAITADELDEVDVVITGSAVAIAETGTIVLDAAPDQGRRVITLVPDHHICVVTAGSIVVTVPEGLARIHPTRPLTMISGPSATSDIELDRVEGVHGPRNLDVIIVSAAVPAEPA